MKSLFISIGRSYCRLFGNYINEINCQIVLPLFSVNANKIGNEHFFKFCLAVHVIGGRSYADEWTAITLKPVHKLIPPIYNEIP